MLLRGPCWLSLAGLLVGLLELVMLGARLVHADADFESVRMGLTRDYSRRREDDGRKYFREFAASVVSDEEWC